MFQKKVLALLLTATMLISIAACGNTADSSGGSDAGAASGGKEPITYNFLMDWNGGAYNFPDGWGNGQVAQKVFEITGVRLNVETINSSETEKLAMVFASGDVPDITNGPFWNTNPGGEGEQIKNAAIAGMLLPLNGYIDKYPNIKRAMTEGVSGAFKDLHLEHPDFKGERYIIPRKPATKDDVTNWAYNVFARKDIMESLGIDPQSVTTAASLRSLLEKIKEGGVFRK